LDENQISHRFLEDGVYLQRVFAVVLIVFMWSAVAAARDLAVVTSKDSHVQELAMADLVKICKGQNSRWPDGRPVSFIMRDPGDPEMKQALEKIYGMSKDQVTALIATANHGRANHPAIEIASSDEDLVKRVGATPGAIGIVDVYSITSSVSVVKLGGKLPLEPGYPLHGN
jgi:hypothetical protein